MTCVRSRQRANSFWKSPGPESRPSFLADLLYWLLSFAFHDIAVPWGKHVLSPEPRMNSLNVLII